MQVQENIRLYTVKEAARIMAVSPATIYNMMNRGELSYIKGERTRVRRISSNDIDKWIRSCRNGKTT